MKLQLEPRTPIMVEWVDAHIDLGDEGTCDQIQALKPQDQTAKTLGWFVKQERGMLVLAIDLWDQAVGKPVRGTFRVPTADVRAVVRLLPGPLAYSTAKAAAPSRRTPRATSSGRRSR